MLILVYASHQPSARVSSFCDAVSLIDSMTDDILEAWWLWAVNGSTQPHDCAIASAVARSARQQQQQQHYIILVMA
jgi:hypothetical protein